MNQENNVGNQITYNSTKSMYNKYLSSINGSQRDNSGRLEKPEVFRDGFSIYNIKRKTVSPGSLSKWDMANCGGIPLDGDRTNNTVFLDGSDAHTILIGATGSKKSRLVVMPSVYTLSASGEAMIVCDPKGEVYKRSWKYLTENNYKVSTVNFREPDKSDGWNMLDIPFSLYKNGNIDEACELINDATINLIPVYSKDPYWDYSARDMLFGLILLLFKIGAIKGMSNDEINMKAVLQLRHELFMSSDTDRVSATYIWQLAKQDYLIRTRLQGIIVCPEKTMSCIISTFDQHMSCFSLQPQVVNMLSKSTFNLDKIGFEKEAVFLIMPDEKTTYHKIIAAFIKQMYEILILSAYKNTSSGKFPIRINFLLDEFSTLPKISDMPQMISASRSRNIRFVLVVQSKHQLVQRYSEEADTIMSNCTNWIILPTREINLLNDISNLAGTVGRDREPLVSVARIQHMNKEVGECLVLSGRKNPYFAFLPDVDEYDNGGDVGDVPCYKEQISGIELPSDYFENWSRNIMYGESSNNSTQKSEVNDIQTELKKQLDELFGTDSTEE